MSYIDAHVHIWTDDLARYPIAAGFAREDMVPAAFTPEHLIELARPAGVTRINLIQVRFHGFDNSYILDAVARYPGVFVATAVIDPLAPEPERRMAELGERGARAFRIHPRLSKQPAQTWLRPDPYRKMFAAAAQSRQAMSCLIDPDGLSELDRMCTSYPDTPVIIDHLARVGADGVIRDAEVNALCGMARHRSVYCKIGGFYALGKKRPPYADLVPLIRRAISAFGPERCMWESDSPYQVEGEHTYRASLDLVREGLDFLSPEDKDWLLEKTAASVLFAQ